MELNPLESAERKPTDATLAIACSSSFDHLPPEMIVRAFGVDYGHVHLPEGGDLFVTRYGWAFLAQLLPANWYQDQWYARHGEKLPGSGHVYHVSTRPVHGKQIEIVVKFSRVAREVPLEVATTFPDDIPPEVIANARFNSPMEEFGLVMELRRGAFGPKDLRVLTQRPLAIYAPPDEFELWQLGRDQSRFQSHWHQLAQDQGNRPKAIELDIKRIYVVLYSWIKGEDAEDALRAGYLSEDECRNLTLLAIDDLRSKGFRVLDNKPKHFILRRTPGDKRVVRTSDNRIVYGLVDFELLQRTPEYQSRFKAAQREKYWHLQAHRPEAAIAALPSHLKQTTIFGVDYLFGATPDGGRLWVVGHDPELFDYFLPDRWRRTSRAKLSLSNEVYHTRTRDGIHVLYRRSRVGAQPRPDPLLRGSKRIREHGYNSPFEEFAIAEQLRAAGVFTIYPRAIYRTGHQSSSPAHSRDDRRFLTHAHLMTPGIAPEPILIPEFDYYTIWGYFRGVDPQTDVLHDGARGITDLEQAYDEGLLTKRQYELSIGDVQHRLGAFGFGVDEIAPHEFAVPVRADGTLQRDAEGKPEVRLCIDAHTAYEHRLISEHAYRSMGERLEGRLRAAGWEILNLAGHHLLLSTDPGGNLKCDEHGRPTIVLCNFEMMRAVQPPIC